jgi:hypothetical protein
MKHLHISVIFLIFILIFTACADNSQNTTANPLQTDITAETTAAETTIPYNYPKEDYAGAQLTILNVTDLWNMLVDIDRDELNGEVLNDAVYTRNRDIEKQYNFTLNEVSKASDTALVTTEAKKALVAGDATYDIMYLSLPDVPPLMLQGYFYNLKSIPELNLDQPWWDQQVVKAATIRDTLFFATSPWHLMAFDGTWCLFFNEDMITDYNLDSPYGLARNGTWTIDKLGEYCRAVANLNGDSNYNWDPEGSSIYGISAHMNMVQKFIRGAGETFVSIGSDGYPELTIENDRFFSLITKLSTIFKDKSGLTIKASTDDFNVADGGYVYIFTAQRALFLTGEIKAAQLMRDVDFTFGILPYPKYDENQASYYSSTVSQMFVFLLPVTNTNTSFAATIADVMSYKSYVDTLPIYFNVVVEQKGLRNDNSIEMLNIIRDTRGIDIGDVFGWTSTLASDIAVKVFNGDDTAASNVAKQRKSIQASIDKMITKFDEMR